jgi:hypothetical protein
MTYEALPSRDKLYCQGCVYQEHPSMITTYCIDARCDRCGRFGWLAICIPKEAERKETK